MPGSVMVAHENLDLGVEVRILTGQPPYHSQKFLAKFLLRYGAQHLRPLLDFLPNGTVRR